MTKIYLVSLGFILCIGVIGILILIIAIFEKIKDFLFWRKIKKENNVKRLKDNIEYSKKLLNEILIALKQTKDGAKYNVSLIADVEAFLKESKEK